MQPAPVARPKARNWKDVQLIISSVSVALSLGLWSWWASREKTESVAEETPVAPAEAFEASTETPVPMLLPGQIIYLSGATPQTNAPVVNQEKPKRRKGGDGGGGGGGGGGGANAGTGSS